MTNAIDGSIFCWDITHAPLTKVDLISVKDLEWERKSCVYAWDSLGIWSNDLKETDIKHISISYGANKLLAVADLVNKVRVFRYPAFLIEQKCLELEDGHLNRVVAA